MKNEIRIFFTALMFYTRIPCPKWVDHSEKYLKKSVRYLPLVGWIIGGLSGLVLIAAWQILPLEIALILSMITSVLLTGAFHEDGLADVCDGFGGGWTKEKILLIMKDSRVGTYGVVAIVLIFLTKYIGLSAILTLAPKTPLHPLLFILLVVISGHSLSRLIALTTIVTHQYVRENDVNSKAKPVVKEDLKWTDITILLSIVLGILPLVFFQNPFVFLILLPMYFTKVLMQRFFNKWIGGYTGDCLGAIQQVSEVVFYLSFIVLWKFI